MNREKARQAIDRMVDFRKRFACHDSSPIRVSLTPAELHAALDLPKPAAGHAYPTSVLHRGYRIESNALADMKRLAEAEASQSAKD